jgi:hypothetical protein
MSRKKEFIRICPKCGSDNTAGTGKLLKMSGGFNCCKCCGYEWIFPEVEKGKIEKFKEMINKKQREK